MTKIILAGATAFAMMTGVAFAQSISSDTTTTTQSTTTLAPAVDSVHASKTQTTIDANGTETDKKQTYSSGPDGARSSTSARTTNDDGTAQQTYHSEQAATPDGNVETHSSTTTVVH